MPVEAKIVSENDATVDYVASDESLDSYNEIILASGWRFSRFVKNAPFVDSHNYESIRYLLGRVERAEIKGRTLVERVKWAADVPEQPLAALGWKMTLGGYLKAVSVGFFPLKVARNGRDGWSTALQAAGMEPAKAAEVRAIYLEQEQIELSACVIGANPNALAKSWKDGCVRDADLAACGFSDDDMEFLKLAGEALEKPETDPAIRALIRRETARITGRTNLSNGPMQHSSKPPGKPGGGGDAERLAAERRDFLRKLQA